jgi:succinyl-diaminopimelate desuccinylase
MKVPPTDPVALTQALIRCPSVTPEEGGALSLLEDILKPAGFRCHRMTFRDKDTPDVENLYARLGTKGPNLCFAGHTDVVPPGDLKAWTVPPFSGEVKSGYLYGRGAVDMKGGSAAFLAATMRVLKSSNGAIPGSISFLITGDEEGPSINGTMKVLDWLKEQGEKLDACVVGEPSNPEVLGEEIKIGRRGSVNCELIVHGKQGHAAYPQKADNPVPKLVHILERLSREPIDSGSAHFQASDLQVTILSVPNTAANVIPREARATFNIRYNDLWNRARIEDWVKLQCEAAASRLDVRYDMTFSGTGDVFLTKPGPLVDKMSEAIMAVTGRKAKLTTGGGTSDARFIKDHCPVIEFGLVNTTIHSVDERVPLADLEALTKIYERFIADFMKS